MARTLPRDGVPGALTRKDLETRRCLATNDRHYVFAPVIIATASGMLTSRGLTTATRLPRRAI